ncbi:MAG: type VI secretion system tube protein Hcp, partial [Planctomycetes bacterium]|nr:type VI secretion system tube protein Hcp [Planctomycetota bacterium]
FQDNSVTKWFYSASHNLMLYCANGDHFEKATLTVRKAGKNPLEYIVIDMEKVIITSVSTGGSGGEDRLTENVSLNFAKVTVAYKEQKADGSGMPAKEFTWDIAANAQ